jgi:membrane protease YdiL (CAAX protease family)
MNMIATVNRQSGGWWKFLQFPVTRFVLAVLAVGLSVAVLQAGGKLLGVSPHSPQNAVLGLLIIAGVLASYFAYVRLIEKREVIELGRDGALKELGLGLLVGTALFCTTMLILWLAGAWTYTSMNSWRALVYPLVGALVAGVLEETVMRGVLFRILEESLGSWIALAVSAVIFGVLHAFNPGATAVSDIAIALEAGILLGAAYMYARRLWLVIGVHVAWNFTEGGIFATNVSGGKIQGLLGVRFSGTDILTGGTFGPEASIVAILVCLSAGIAFIVLARRCGRLLPPLWRRASPGTNTLPENLT